MKGSETYSAEDLDWKDLGQGISRASVELKRGETAVNFASTKGPLYGPASIVYEKTPGGITTYID